MSVELLQFNRLLYSKRPHGSAHVDASASACAFDLQSRLDTI